MCPVLPQSKKKLRAPPGEPSEYLEEPYWIIAELSEAPNQLYKSYKLGTQNIDVPSYVVP